MNAKSQGTASAWIDPDDAPELTDEFFDKGSWKIGDHAVSLDEARVEHAARRGRPAGGANKISTTIRFDADVLDAFRAMGDGWQTRINDVLKEWLASR